MTDHTGYRQLACAVLQSAALVVLKGPVTRKGAGQGEAEYRDAVDFLAYGCRDTTDPLMAGLKARPRRVKGRCGACSMFDICGGNTRVRAQQMTGDPWSEDPGCYLSDEEIGIT